MNIFLKPSLILCTHLRLGLPNCLFPCGFLTKNLYVFLFPIRASSPAHLLDNSNCTWRIVRSTKLLVMQFSAPFCNLIPSPSKYSPQHPTPACAQSIPPHPVSPRSHLIHIHLLLGLPSGLSSCGFSIKNTCTDCGRLQRNSGRFLLTSVDHLDVSSVGSMDNVQTIFELLSCSVEHIGWNSRDRIPDTGLQFIKSVNWCSEHNALDTV
jgi:hypothetical protein